MSGIVTDGLVGYWHYKQGVNSNQWENIAPDTKGSYNGQINGAVLQNDGMYFDGVDDSVVFPNLGIVNKSFTLEVRGYYSGKNGYLVIDGFTHRIGFFTNNIIQSLMGGGGFTNSPANTITIGNWYHLTYRYNYKIKVEELFVNGNRVASRSNATTTNLNVSLCMSYTSVNATKYNGLIPYLRVYDRELSDMEISQNYTVGTDVGLENQTNHPVITKLVVDKEKISDEETMNQSIITVQFDKDVSEYVARLNGSDYSTGALVHQGGAVSANTDAQAIIDWDELSSEGANRINIYGKGENGQWTPYTPN